MLSVSVAQAAICTCDVRSEADCECELVLKSLLVFVVAGCRRHSPYTRARGILLFPHDRTSLGIVFTL